MKNIYNKTQLNYDYDDIMKILGDYTDKKPDNRIKIVQSVKFISDNDIVKNLISNFDDIINEIMIFNHNLYHEKKVEPIETILALISLKKKFDVIINRKCYEIVLKGVCFKQITNFLSKSSIDKINVQFECDDILYNNLLLTKEEKRSIQLDRIIKKINE